MPTDFESIENGLISDFSDLSESDLVSFIPIGDDGVIIVTAQTGFGEGGFGEGPFGGETLSYILSPATTIWEEIDTP